MRTAKNSRAPGDICRLQYVKVINSGYSHISEPAQELHSRAEPSVGGNITSQSVKPQGKILEEDRKKKKAVT